MEKEKFNKKFLIFSGNKTKIIIINERYLKPIDIHKIEDMHSNSTDTSIPFDVPTNN